MYQFSSNLENLKISAPKTYRWHGLAAGLVGGWLPAWGLNHLLGWGGWGFSLIWLLTLPAGYGLGRALKRKK